MIVAIGQPTSTFVGFVDTDEMLVSAAIVAVGCMVTTVIVTDPVTDL